MKAKSTQTWCFVLPEGDRVEERGVLYGAMRCVREVSDYCQFRGGVNVVILSASSSGPAIGDSTTTLYLGSLQAQAGWVTANSPEVVVGVSTARVFGLARGSRNIVYHHNPTMIDGVAEHGRELFRVLQSIIVVSEHARRYQISLGVPSHLIHVIRNGIDHTVFCDKACARQRHRLAFCGMMVDYKGVDLALRAFQEVSQEFRTAELHMIGCSRTFSRHAASSEATEWMRSHGFLKGSGEVDWPRVEQDLSGVFYRGELASTQLADEFRNTSVLLSGSRIAETFGLVSIEAQACGCIPIVPDHGGLPETIKPNVTGVTYDPCNASSMTDRIRRLFELEDSGNLEVWRRAATEWATSTFSWQRTGASFIETVSTTPSFRWTDSLAAAVLRNSRKVRQFMGVRPRTRCVE